jgi:hypothetical protein
LPLDRPFKTHRTVPGYFRQVQNTFEVPRTILTAKFTFGICNSALAAPKHFWKGHKRAGTVPALLAPV